MEKIVVLDTDVIIDFFSGREPIASIVANLIEQNRLVLTSISVFELYAGITGKKRLKQINDLISAIPVHPLKKEDARAASRIYTNLRKAGKLIGNQDILIAGICINHDVPLLTRNIEHFSRISSLKIYEISRAPVEFN